MFQGLEDDRPVFRDIVDGFLDEDHDKVLRIANSVLFQKIPPRGWGSPQSPRAREAVQTAIETLWAHTVPSNERWIGHLSIPPRVDRLNTLMSPEAAHQTAIPYDAST